MKKLLLLLIAFQPALALAGVTKAATTSASSASNAAAVSAAPLSAPSLLAPSSLAPSLLTPALAAPSVTPAPVPAALAAPLAAPASVSKDGRRAAVIERLHRRFVALDATFPIPDASPAARLRRHIRAELLDTARTVAEADASLLETVAGEADRALAAIQKRLDAGEIDPSLDLRVDPDGAPVAAHSRPLKVGVYTRWSSSWPETTPASPP
ncbi:MAG: hypothetical protein HYX59_04965 [Elusimicrobia bacterium]|nr:hypothetical protein [Elusimicrobiota bacterium]